MTQIIFETFATPRRSIYVAMQGGVVSLYSAMQGGVVSLYNAMQGGVVSLYNASARTTGVAIDSGESVSHLVPHL